MTSAGAALTKSGPSQVLAILGDSWRDLAPLLRADAVFYVTLGFLLWLCVDLQSHVRVHPGQATLLLAKLAFLFGKTVILVAISGVAATRAARAFGRPELTRVDGVKRYGSMEFRSAIYAFVPIVIFFLVSLPLLWYFNPARPAFMKLPFWVLARMYNPWMPFFQLALLLGTPIYAFFASMKLAPSPSLRLLDDGITDAIGASWKLTNRFWEESFLLALASTALAWGSHFVLWMLFRHFGTLVLSVLGVSLNTVFTVYIVRAYMQFSREMLDATPTGMQAD